VTEIISVLTDEYVALVSDRRVTWEDGTRGDSDTKTFNLFGQFLMGFTGFARIDGFRMEKWVADILRGVPPEEYFNVLFRGIGAVFDRIPPSKRKSQAFLATGFASFQPGGRIYPMNVIISNSIDNEGNYKNSALQQEFTVYIEPLGNRRQWVRAVGYPMSDKIKQVLEHKIRVVAKADPFNPERAAGPLVYALREVAKESNEWVGNATLFASLPRCAVPSPAMVTGQIKQLDFRRHAVSLYLPDNVRNPTDASIYMPAFISPNLQTIGLRMYPGSPQQPIDKQDGF
jgi:hypothetical protein